MTTPTKSTVWHSGRSWSGHAIEDDCPCVQEPCGLVNLAHAHPDCKQHRLSPALDAKAMRQGHRAQDCPGKRAALAEVDLSGEVPSARARGPRMVPCSPSPASTDTTAIARLKGRETVAEPAVLSWDWREQPDLDGLARIVLECSGGRVHITPVENTGDDQHAILVGTRTYSQDEATALYADEVERG